MKAVSVDALQPGDRIEGKYEVRSVLGKGGMGVVVAATHLDLQETVALKFLLPEAAANPGAVDRFLVEARAVRRLRSEHVVRVIDVGRLPDSGLPYMAMELLAGKDLARTLDASGPMPVATACDFVIQACDALAEAHACGVIHRDIKPANLFALATPSGRPAIKVLDFGIAKVIDPAGSTTKTQAVMGSATYMSPEQMRSSKHVDGRTDLWALGVTLYELLTGRHPFEGASLSELIVAITLDPPVAPRTHRPELPPGLEQVVLRCIEKSPDRRFASAGELAQALAAFAGPEAAALAASIRERSANAGASPRISSLPDISGQGGEAGPGAPTGTFAGELPKRASTAADFAISKLDARPAAARKLGPGGAVAAALGALALVFTLLAMKSASRPAADSASAASGPVASAVPVAVAVPADAPAARPAAEPPAPPTAEPVEPPPAASAAPALPARGKRAPGALSAAPAAAPQVPARPTTNPSKLGTSID